jgi:DNA-binding MarR family transcriptional regulator
MNPKPYLVLSPLHKALRKIDIYLDKHFHQLGYSVKEAHLMGYLLYYSPCTVNKLVEVLGVKNSTLTSMITRLEDKALLKRNINSEDKRSFQIILTSKGEVIAKKLDGIVRNLERKILKEVSSQNLLHLNKIVHEIEFICK